MKKYYIILLFLLINILAFSQDDTHSRDNDWYTNLNIKPDSPAAAQFLRYDEHPVSEYTGVPDISIPIYEIKTKGISAPIKLSYHAGGIKVNQQAGWVGLGWSLQLGSLVQIINDEDDIGPHLDSRKEIKKALPDYPGAPTGQGCISTFPKRYNYPFSLDGAGWSAVFKPLLPVIKRHVHKFATDAWIPIGGNFSVKREEFFDDTDRKYAYDTEPDIFKMNVFGESLHFILDWSSTEPDTYISLNKKGYSIKRNSKGWTVINPQGVSYEFQAKTESITNGYSGGFSFKKKSMVVWLLTKIVSPHGEEITIDYEITSTFEMPESKSTTNKEKASEVQYYKSYGELSDVSSLGGTTPMSSTVISKTSEPYSFIKKITFPGGIIDFSLSGERLDISESKKLDGITVKNNLGKTVKSITFSYGYFIQTDNNKRLKLEEIIDNDGVYTFKYDSKSLPPILSNSQDCWGYYNGHPNPVYSEGGVNILSPNPSRYALPSNWVTKDKNNNFNLSSNLPFTKAGVLEEITYPTGGKVFFEYESNTFDNYRYRVPDYHEIRSSTNEGLTKGHGLRIRKISYKDKDNTTLKETMYEYEGGKAVLPKMLFRRVNMRYVDSNVYGGKVYVFDIESEENSVSGFTTSNPLSSFDGVGYSKVIRKEIGASVGNSRIETSYNNRPDITFYDCSEEEALIPVPAYKNIDFPQGGSDVNTPQNGTVSLRKVFNSNNAMIKEENYKYKNSLSATYYGARISSYGYYCVLGSKFGTGESLFLRFLNNLVVYYPIFDAETLLTEKEEKHYNGDQPTVIKQTYEYDNMNRMSCERKPSVATSSLSINYYYPKIGSALYKKNMHQTMVEKYTVNSSANEHVKYFYSTSIYPDSLQISYGYGFQTVMTYDRYDAQGNTIQYTTKDGVANVYLWSYSNQYPIAEIKNSTYQEVKNALGWDDSLINALSGKQVPSDSDWDILKNLRSALPQSFITIYKYNPLVGVSEISDPNDFTTYYDYDSFGRLKETYFYENGLRKKIQSYNYHYSNQY